MKRLISALYGFTLFAAALCAPAQARDRRTIIPPAGQCYHGVAVSMYATFDNDLAAFQTAVGKKPALLHWFTPALNNQGKPIDWATTQRKFLARCKQMNVIPCVNYVFQSEKNGHFTGFDAYTRGAMDKQLQGMAALFREYKEPVLLAINHEMNGNWYPWSAGRRHKDEDAAVSASDNQNSAPQPSPDAIFKGYIASWRYVHDFLRKAGCDNVAFCFVASAGGYSNPRGCPHHFSKYYPGDDYVDWLGFDTYNNVTPETLEKLTVEMEALAKGKPLLIKEWGINAQRARAYPGGAKKYPGDAQWINAFFDLVERHPSIRAISYFERGADYKLTRPGAEAGAKAYRARIKDERYNAKPVARDLTQWTPPRQQPPYPPSPVLAGIDWRLASHVQFALGSDQWPMTWAGDDNLYAGWGDGTGWVKDPKKVSMGVTRISGAPPALRGEDLWGVGPGAGFYKPEALIAFDDALHLFWTHGDSRYDDDTWTAVSRDNGSSWTLGAAPFMPGAPKGFRVRGICQFGRGYAGAIDNYLYVYFGFNRQADLYLGRVVKQDIFNAAKYEWFTGLGEAGQSARWSASFVDRKPVFHDGNGFIWHVGVSYNPGLKRFLLTKPHYCAGDDRNALDAAGSRVGSLGVFDAPAPWGPWTTVFYQDDFKDPLVKFSYFIPTKFISADGKDFWLAWSGWPQYDNVNFVQGRFRLK